MEQDTDCVQETIDILNAENAVLREKCRSIGRQQHGYVRGAFLAAGISSLMTASVIAILVRCK